MSLIAEPKNDFKWQKGQSSSPVQWIETPVQLGLVCGKKSVAMCLCSVWNPLKPCACVAYETLLKIIPSLCMILQAILAFLLLLFPAHDLAPLWATAIVCTALPGLVRANRPPSLSCVILNRVSYKGEGGLEFPPRNLEIDIIVVPSILAICYRT